MYIFSDITMVETLKQVARDHNVKIRVICDSQSSYYGGPQAINELKKTKGIQVKVHSSEPGKACLHNKFCIVDGKRLLLGSYNFTKKAYMSNHENILILNQQFGAINKYQEEFDKLWQAHPDVSRTYWSSSNRIESQEIQDSISSTVSMKDEIEIEEVFEAKSGSRPLKLADASPTIIPSASSSRQLAFKDSLRQAHQPIPPTEACLGKRNGLQLDDSCLEDLPHKRMAIFARADVSELSRTRDSSTVRPSLDITSLASFNFTFQSSNQKSGIFSRLFSSMCYRKRQLDI